MFEDTKNPLFDNEKKDGFMKIVMLKNQSFFRQFDDLPPGSRPDNI
jgi:hypothetical protein